MVTVYCVLEPRLTVWLVGTAETVKVLGTFTTRVTVALCIREPLVAVIVSG
jgi:hypothetical protein